MFFDSLFNALLQLTMVFVPRVFEKRRILALPGALWAVAPWALLAYWFSTSTLVVNALDVSVLLHLFGIAAYGWSLIVFGAAWLYLYSQYRTFTHAAA